MKSTSEKRAEPENSCFNVAEMPAANPIIINSKKCTGCNRCVDICQVDLLLPNNTKGAPPVVMYPGECWYCGCCIVECPEEGAIKLRHPLMNRVFWTAKENLK